jgi:hypothetical protein
MTISRISSATNNGTGVTLGTHAKGDLILYLAYNFNSATIPTLPVSVTSIYTRSGSSGAHRIGYYIADSSSETVGTTGWTNADNVTAIVYRASSTSVVVPSFISASTANSTTMTYAVQVAGTFKENATDIWYLGYCMFNSATNSLATLAPAGMTNVNNSVGAGFEVAVHDTNATRASIWAQQTVTGTVFAIHFETVIELLEVDHQATTGGGLILPRSMNGGYSA